MRASHTDVTQRLMGKCVSRGVKDIAIFCLDTGYGKEVLGDPQRALSTHGVKPVAQVALAVDGKNIDAVVAEGLVRAGRDVSRAKLRTALTDGHNFDLGGFDVNYTSGPFVGSKFVDMGVFNASGRFNG